MGWLKQDRYSGWATYINDKHPDDILLGFEYEIDVNINHYKDVFMTSVYNGQEERRLASSDVKLPWELPKKYLWEYEGLNAHYGVEIKSPVMPLRNHRKEIQKFLMSKIPFNTQKNGERNDGGIHVSIDSAGPAKNGMNKVFNLLHYKIKKEELIKIGCRDTHKYSIYCPQQINKKNWGHHHAVINNQNPERYEFRLFAAQPHLLLPALEMGESLFCAANTVDNLTLNTYRQYIDNKLRYSAIRQHLNEVL